MKLSEAIRLGSLAIQNPRKGDPETCAIGMACTAIGMWLEGCMNYAVLAKQWPWTEAGKPQYYQRMTTLFDSAVCRKEMTLEALCDQVRAWEDELAAKGINVEQVTMAATPEATHEPAAEHTEKVSV